MHPSIPPPTSKAYTQIYYDRLSRWYDLLAGSAEEKCKRKGLELLNAQPGERILEIGPGTGGCLLALAVSVGEQGKVFGIDLSTGMLQVAQDRLRKANLLDGVELYQGDARQLPFPDGLFDAITMSFTLELFASAEIPAVLAECKRVLGKRGRVSIVSMAYKENAGPMVRLYEWAHRKWPRYIDCRPICVEVELGQSGFQVARRVEISLFGLPVTITLAHPV